MTLDDITKRIEAIRIAGVVQDDDEKAHGLEDALREDFIKYIVGLSALSQTLSAQARLVLTTNDLAFSRWCA
jgi:hypothetical protein